MALGGPRAGDVRSRRLDDVLRTKLATAAVVSLVVFAALAVVVAHDSSPFVFEDRVLDRLGNPSTIGHWYNLIEILSFPAIAVVVLAAAYVATIKAILVRVAVYAACGGAAFLISEHLAKPLVHRTYAEVLTFPSGHVTAVSAAALAMWLALLPVLGTWARRIAFATGVLWVALISLAVVGAHWHTPLDCVGSVLLSTGVIATGAFFFESTAAGRRTWPASGDAGPEVPVAHVPEQRSDMVH